MPSRVIQINLVGTFRHLMNEGIRVKAILPSIFNTPLLQEAPENVKAALSALSFPKRLGLLEEYAQLALTMITNGYFNGEGVRLHGAIRMAPREEHSRYFGATGPQIRSPIGPDCS